MATALVPVFTGTLADRTTQLCDARALHGFMQVKRDFTTWIKGRIRKFGFVQDTDYMLKVGSPDLVNQTRGGNRKETTDYHLTLDMAKELAMVENNEQGRAARRYFIECERKALEQQPAATPYTVQPGDKLSEPQQIALRAMLEANIKRLPYEKQAAAMRQGWSKLKAHFGVPYRQIPASEFSEAMSIVARHLTEWELVEEAPQADTVQEIVADWVKKIEAPNGYPAMLFQPIVDAVGRKTGRSQPAQPGNSLLIAAQAAATEAGAHVQRAVFNAVLSGTGEWQHTRWFFALVQGENSVYVRPMERGDFISNWPRLVKDVASGECMCSSAELLDMAAACMQRLQQRGGPKALAA